MELQAVILAAGLGSRIMDLTANKPKALLSIANKPMIWYPIQLLEKAKFKEALVVTRESSQPSIQKTLEEKCTVNLHLEYVVIPDDDDYGTADTLRHIQDKIKSDLLLVSCDLITDASIDLVIDLHRTYDSTLTMLLAPLPKLSASSVPGGKSNRKIEKDFIGFDETGNRVLFMASEADFEENITFRKSLLKKHPFIDIRSGLLDAHLYIMKKWVIDYIIQEKSISAVKGELVPHLIHKQFSHPKVNKEGDTERDISDFVEGDEFTKLAQEYSSWNDHHGDLEGCFHGDRIHCHAYLMNSGFCFRTNTLWAYCEANRQFAAESVISEESEIGENASVKRSTIDSHCKIAERVKVTNSVIMDHVRIEEGTDVSGSVVLSNIHIGEGCILKDCVVGINIKPKSTHKNEILVDSNRMMEIV